MNILKGVYEMVAHVWAWIQPFWDSAANLIPDALATTFGELLSVAYTIAGVIPIPASLANFQWPTIGTWGVALVHLGVPESLALLVGAYTVKMTMRLVPLVFR